MQLTPGKARRNHGVGTRRVFLTLGLFRFEDDSILMLTAASHRVLRD